MRLRIGFFAGLVLALSPSMSPARAAVSLVPPQGYQTNQQYSASNAGISNVQASSPASGGASTFGGTCQGVVTYNTDHGESDIQIDPHNSNHLLAASKFFYSDSQYVFHLGSYVSFNGGSSFSDQIIPGYDCVTSGNPQEWVNTTDPTVTFDGQGNAYALVLAFNWQSTNSPDAVVGVSKSTDGGRTWRTPTILATEQSAALGDSFDKQWITAHGNNVFAAWAVFNGNSVTAYDSYSTDAGTTWSKPTKMTSPSIDQPQNTYVYPRFAPDGTLYVAFTNSPNKQQQKFGYEKVYILKSTDGGATFTNQGPAATFNSPPAMYQNTTFRDGIDDYFQVSPYDGSLLLAYQDWNLEGTGTTDIFAMISHDGGKVWSTPILVNDDPNTAATDQLQPAIAAAPGTGRIAVAFYDRRLPCPSHDSNILTADWGATNFCINTSVQFYDANLTPIGHNVRASADTWDPQQNPSIDEFGEGFIGDYFGLALSNTQTRVFNVSTANLGSNPDHYQQQILQTVTTP
ncbi:MAG TPA: sialidase family protein [Chloroflexota bacterium]